METLLKDIRYAVAMMRRNKSFATSGLAQPLHYHAGLAYTSVQDQNRFSMLVACRQLETCEHQARRAVQ